MILQSRQSFCNIPFSIFWLRCFFGCHVTNSLPVFEEIASVRMVCSLPSLQKLKVVVEQTARMSIKQRTIRKERSIKGKSLHTGEEVNLTIKPADINQGFIFRRVDLYGKRNLTYFFKCYGIG